MDLTRPATTLLSRLDSAALGTLYRSDRSLTVREVHRLSGTGSYEGIRLALMRLARSGLTRAEERSSGTFYELNKRHIAYPAVEVLMSLRARLIELIDEAVRDWERRPVHLSLFGSFARQDGDSDSDIDVLLVYDDAEYADEGPWADRATLLEESVRAWTGNHVTALTMSLSELRSMARGRRGSGLWRSLLKEALVVTGPSLVELVR